MEKSKVLTIVVPSYNVEKYLSETMDSLILCKSLPSLEIIIVNDGSKDRTLEIAEAYNQQHPESVTVINKANGGHGSTINSGLEIATGKYFIVIDGDDWVDNKVMDELVSFMESVDSDVIVTGHYRNYINNGKEEVYTYPETKGFKADVAYLNSHSYQIPMTDICYKTDLLHKVGLRIQEHTFYVDEEFCTIPFEVVETVTFFNHGFYHYRIGDAGQSISIKNMVARVDHKTRVLERLLSKYKENEMPVENKYYFLNRISTVVNTTLLIYLVLFDDKQKGKELANKMYNSVVAVEPEIASICQSQFRKLSMLNKVHFPGKWWESYKRFQYRIKH